ncbi:hypothetical protein ACGFNU_39905 [Spirillospora sp. NPDC048911]|uniref:hypothetical protein n=1 Tax=Spirillospora sp. NPDC048911 TaxID=3364527 RepID=UPI003713A020
MRGLKLGTVAAALAVLAATAPTLTVNASASSVIPRFYIYVEHGDDYSEAQYEGTRTRVGVHDVECDDNSVWAEYYRVHEGPLQRLNAAGCRGGERFTGWGDNKVYQIRVCEETKGCSAWKNG